MNVEDVVDSGGLATHLAWRSLLLSGLTVSAAVGLALASEALFTLGHVGICAAGYCICFSLAYPLSRFLRQFGSSRPLPAYFGEGRLSLLMIAGILLLPGEPELAVSGYLALCVCLLSGSFADAFWLSEVGGRRGVGLRRAVVLALSAQPLRVERRRPGGVGG